MHALYSRKTLENLCPMRIKKTGVEVEKVCLPWMPLVISIHAPDLRNIRSAIRRHGLLAM